MLEMLKLAAKIATPPDPSKDLRGFWLGAIGCRSDGALIHAKNGAVHCTSVENYHLLPNSHAECRAVNKMDSGGILYVARVRRRDFTLGCAKPCYMCQIKIRAKNIKKVYFTIDEFYYGIWHVKKNIYKICEV